MKLAKIVGLCLAAVFALSLTAASGASAAEWGLCKTATPANTGAYETSECLELSPTHEGSWEFTKDTEKLPVTSKGKLKLEDMGAGTKIECNGTDKGSVGPGAEDEITEITETGCTFITTGSCESSPAPKAHALNLPWKTKLELVGGKVRDKLEKHAGGSAPGWAVECKVGGIFKITDECTGETDTGMEMGAAGSGVSKAVFDAISNEEAKRATCSVGGSKTGLVEGTDEIEGSSGLTFGPTM